MHEAAAPITRAMVLGAGMGSRMRDLTANKPKPMVMVDGRPLVDHVLARLVDAGVTDVVVNVHYKANVLEAHLCGRARPRITISDERDELLDTGGGVAHALPHFRNDAFFVHNADSIWLEHAEPALAAMMRVWDAERMDTLLLLAASPETLGYSGKGDFVRGSDGRIRRCDVNDDAGDVFTGVSIAHPRLFRNAPNGAFSLNVVWDQAMAEGRIFGTVLDGLWMHVGTPEAVAEADAALSAARQL